MSTSRRSNPYNLKVKLDEGFMYEEKPEGFLNGDEFINYLNKNKIDFRRGDNLARFCNNNNILMIKVRRVGSEGATPYCYKKPTDLQIQKITENLKNNNNSFLGRQMLKRKKEKILQLFDSSDSASDYDKKIKDAIKGKADKKKIEELKNEKKQNCYSRTSLAKKVSKILNVSCNRKLVASVISSKRSSQKHKLIKKD